MSDTLKTCTRFEIIDKTGRALVLYVHTPVTYSEQDGGKTLKVFLNEHVLRDEVALRYVDST
jgi:hypothetical protein